MKPRIKILGFLLILVYSSYVFRIIFPIVDYALNYTFIINELCEQRNDVNNSCQGRCHLSKEIQKQVDDDRKEKIVVFDFIKIPHQINKKYYVHNQSLYIEKIILLNSQKKIEHSTKPLLPPPKVNSDI